MLGGMEERTMGLPPTGKIVARPLLVRACGCKQEFQHYEVDKYRAQRQAKFQSTRCPACVDKLLAERKQGEPIPKAEALKKLPDGAHVVLTYRDGNWSGTLEANGVQVEAAGQGGAGPQAVIGDLAQRWLGTSGTAS
jgi:hypothetical protein